MATFVLVPGAWLGAWVWDRVLPPLRAEGHRVYPLTLPGLSDRAAELTRKMGLRAHVDDVVGFVRGRDLWDLILVGHSYAGAVVGAVARRVPRRVRVQVYLDTMPLDEGTALLDGFSPQAKARFRAALTDRQGALVWPMPEPLGAQAPVDGLTPVDLDLLRQRSTPHPARSFEERLSGPIDPGPFPRSHAISCVEDARAAAVEREEFLRGRPDWKYDALVTGHWPMLSAPAELAATLLRIAREGGPPP